MHNSHDLLANTNQLQASSLTIYHWLHKFKSSLCQYVRDGEMNVSSIQKYVKNKLGLGAQTEVSF
jgi:hypothetical protein